MTPTGIEPTTFRIVAHYFNQMRHHVLQMILLVTNNSEIHISPVRKIDIPNA
jgi:hypothetical protein